jgi:outer membrane protein assembly factor BamB
MSPRGAAAVACVLSAALVARANDWPGWLGAGRDSVWRETGIVEAFPAGGPKVLWRAAVAAGYAGPAVAAGRVYVPDFKIADGTVQNDPGARVKLRGVERLHCLDAKTGKTLWVHEHPTTYQISYPSGPRCTPAVADGKVWALGAEGWLVCLDAATGKVIWAHDLRTKYAAKTPIWGFCGHPLVDGPRLIVTVGGPGSVVVAFDKNTGKEIWKALSAREPGYGPPVIIEHAGVRQLLLWHAEAVNSLNPNTGAVYWSVPLAPDYGMSIAVPRKAGDHLFCGGINHKAAMLKLSSDKPGATVAWKADPNTGLGPVNATPYLEGDHLYGVDRDGQLRCVEIATGKRVWETFAPTTGSRRANSATAFLVKHAAGRFFLFNERGELILAKLSPSGYEEISRAKLLEPTGEAFGRSVVWSHPAFADKCVFVRNDKEIVCVSLAAK